MKKTKEITIKEHERDNETQQWRVAFTYLTNIGGHMLRAKGHTRWFDTMSEARTSRWLREDDSRIETRIHRPMLINPPKQ